MSVGPKGPLQTSAPILPKQGEPSSHLASVTGRSLVNFGVKSMSFWRESRGQLWEAAPSKPLGPKSEGWRDKTVFATLESAPAK